MYVYVCVYLFALDLRNGAIQENDIFTANWSDNSTDTQAFILIFLLIIFKWTQINLRLKLALLLYYSEFHECKILTYYC